LVQGKAEGVTEGCHLILLHLKICCLILCINGTRVFALA